MGAWPDSRVVGTSSESADFPQKGKTVFDDETYLEKRLGIVKHGFIRGFSLRNFLVFGQKWFSDQRTFLKQKVLF